MQPKKKTSNSRKGMRRSHIRMRMPHVDYCPQCGSAYRAHHACGNCGFVNPRLSLAVEEES